MARILIVDDSDFIRIVLKKYLISKGHEVVGASPDGATAIELYKTLSPDLVTMDIVMQDDGLWAVEEIMKIDPKAKVIMYASQATPLNIIRAVKIGAKAFIMKPMLDEALGQTIEYVLTNKCSGCDFEIEEDSLFLLSMFNHSMNHVGILMNNILVIDKNATPQNMNLVLNAYNSYLGFGRCLEDEHGNKEITMESDCVVKIDKTQEKPLGIVKSYMNLASPDLLFNA